MPQDKGIYGMMTQLTVTGAVRQQDAVRAGERAVARPEGDLGRLGGRGATRSRRRRNTPFGMAWDRSGHRFAGPAISYGAKYFDADGKPAVVDDGFKAAASRFVEMEPGRHDRQGRLGGHGRRLSRRLQRVRQRQDRAVPLRQLAGAPHGEADRQRVRLGRRCPNPAARRRAAACPAAPPSSRSSSTKSPKEVARFLDYLAQPSRCTPKWMSETANIPAQMPACRRRASTYKLSPAGKAAIAGVQRRT